MEEIRHAVYARARHHETGGPEMLWLLDEVANIAPIHDLPALVSQAGGQGLQVTIGLQDLPQATSQTYPRRGLLLKGTSWQLIGRPSGMRPTSGEGRRRSRPVDRNYPIFCAV